MLHSLSLIHTCRQSLSQLRGSYTHFIPSLLRYQVSLECLQQPLSAQLLIVVLRGLLNRDVRQVHN